MLSCSLHLSTSALTVIFEQIKCDVVQTNILLNELSLLLLQILHCDRYFYNSDTFKGHFVFVLSTIVSVGLDSITHAYSVGRRG